MAKVIFTTVETVARVYEADIEELVDLFVEREGEMYLTPVQEEVEENKVTYVEVKE